MRLVILLYSVCGQGHAAVMAGLARGVLAADSKSSVLVVSGGMMPPPGCFPDGVDIVQLPGYAPSVGLFSGLVPRAHNVPAELLKKTRQRMLTALIHTLRPDVLLTEHYPFGRHAFAKEIERVLLATASSGTRLISALAVLGGQLTEHRNQELLLQRTQRFDRILVHTDPKIERLDDDYPVAAPLLAEQVFYTGYVLSQLGPPRPRQEVRALLGVPATAPLLFAQAGGGRDGAELLRRVLLALPRVEPRPTLLLVGGPVLPAAEAAELEALAGQTAGARFERTRTDLFDLVAAADAVVGMAGYASCAELLAVPVPSLLAPRPDEEQQRRARRLQKLGRAEILAPDADLSAVAAALTTLLRRPWATADGVQIDGARCGAAEILAVSQREPRCRSAPAPELDKAQETA